MNNITVSTAWLVEHLDDSNFILLDASMDVVLGKEPLVYEQFRCIPNTLNMHLEQDFFDHQSSMSHAMPTAEQFTQAAQKLGINQDSVVVIYDNQGMYSAPRAWWTFKTMGFEKVFILDGGLPQWMAESLPTADQYIAPLRLGNAKAIPQNVGVCDSRFMLCNFDKQGFTIIDARAEGRFKGQVSEPRAGVRSGHIPGSVNLPFAQVLDGYKLKSSVELSALFERTIQSNAEQLIFSCGSGITACILLVAAKVSGVQNVMLYDGSWAEWGSCETLPITRGQP
ncbi:MULTISPECIES: sulfurtransferase [Pseudomonadati]|uniref:Sulfurtransferase n=1 Tax=Shewanella aestuarii TaxID=1028752 RepID=A0ABT0L003_9GAMM|nr:sulfurtransferase [Shewanella aestuarii]MCL1116944.1 sulfurtransferase [Shewanella aestuarii]GGN78263.1 sulfurtransferase [Shewanella aestuarii]